MGPRGTQERPRRIARLQNTLRSYQARVLAMAEAGVAAEVALQQILAAQRVVPISQVVR